MTSSKAGSRVLKALSAKLDTGTVDKAFVSSLRKALHAADRKAYGYSIGRTSAKIDPDDLWAIVERVEKERPLVDLEHFKGGMAVLTKSKYRKRLEAYADVIAAAHHIRLVGLQEAGGRMPYYTPVYALYNEAETMRLPYVNVPWQSGGNGPEVVYTY